MKLLISAILLTALVGCASMQNDSLELPIMYTTLKVIERDNDISEDDVLQAMQRLRDIVERDFSLEQGVSVAFQRSVDMSKLDAADRLFVMRVLQSIESNFESEQKEVSNTRALTLIEYVEQAARMY